MNLQENENKQEILLLCRMECMSKKCKTQRITSEGNVEEIKNPDNFHDPGGGE